MTSALDKAHPIPGGTEQLNEISRQLFGKRYIVLADDEANAVWDEIERQEGESCESKPAGHC